MNIANCNCFKNYFGNHLALMVFVTGFCVLCVGGGRRLAWCNLESHRFMIVLVVPLPIRRSEPVALAVQAGEAGRASMRAHRRTCAVLVTRKQP